MPRKANGTRPMEIYVSGLADISFCWWRLTSDSRICITTTNTGACTSSTVDICLLSSRIASIVARQIRVSRYWKWDTFSRYAIARTPTRKSKDADANSCACVGWCKGMFLLIHVFLTISIYVISLDCNFMVVELRT
jgi:hypothetical protein